MKVKGVPPRAFIFMWPGFVYVVLTCSTGGCFGRANVFARESAMLKLQKRGENGASLPNLPVIKSKSESDRSRVILRLVSCKQKKVLLRSGEQSEPSEMVM